MSSHDDDRKLANAGARLELTQQFHAVDARHADIRHHASDRKLWDFIEKNLRGIEKTHFEPSGPEQEVQRVAHRGVVIDDINSTGLRHRSLPWQTLRAG